jgi:peptidyl-prolyl cis-trans isomerase SurA
MSFTRILFFAFVLASLGVFGACSSVPKDVLAFIASDTLHVSEYEDMFLRTRTNPPHNEEEKQAFLSTYSDFLLKVKEAERLGLHEEADFRKEFREYRDQLALNLLYERTLAEPGMRKLYDRRLEEIKLQQLVVRWLPGESNDGDTIQTWEKAQVIHGILKASDLSFDSLVMLYSDEAAKTRTRGEIGWIIAGTSFPWLDDMMYEVQPGQRTPHPLRTGFGYHFIKVLDRKPARQRLRPAQILCRLDLENRDDTTAAHAKLTLLRDSLQRGLATFEELARRHSQDTLSGPNGGDLGWMTRGTNIEANFEDAILNLSVGELSKVVRTPFGMHLIKLLDEEPAEPYEKQKDMLRRIYRNERFSTDFLNYSKALRERYNYTLHANVLERFLGSVDTAATTSTPGWDRRFTPEDRAAYLLRTDVGPVTIGEAVDFIKTEQTVQMRRFTRSLLDTVAIMLADHQLALHETRDFETTLPEFRRLLNEYRATALITRLEEREVWNSVQPTEAEVKTWWQQHREEFIMPPRVKIAEIFTYNEMLANQYRDSLYAGLDFGYLAGRYTQRPGYFRKQGEWDHMEYNHNDLSRTAAGIAVGHIVGPIPFEGGFSLIKLLDKQERREMTWEEAAPLAYGMYRNERIEQLKVEWLAILRERHQVRIFPGHLPQAFPAATKKVN